MEIEAAAAEEARLGLEIQDCLTDVTTPEGSDDELEMITDRELVGENHEAAAEQLEEFLDTPLVPNNEVAYHSLYQDPTYLLGAERKFKKLRKVARECDFNKAFHDKRFWRQYTRVRDLYGELGGRDRLNGLVAIYCWWQDGGDEDGDDEDSSDESESGSDSDSSVQEGKEDHEDPPPPPSASMSMIMV
jgi:hypothetical protein